MSDTSKPPQNFAFDLLGIDTIATGNKRIANVINRELKKAIERSEIDIARAWITDKRFTLVLDLVK